MRYGLSENQIKDIIQQQLDKKPDLKYYINNSYLEELVSLLIDGISVAIVKNSKKVIDDIEREARRKEKVWE